MSFVKQFLSGSSVDGHRDPCNKGLSVRSFSGGIVVTCVMLWLISFLMFLFTLDRYPTFFIDEPWFGEPAARYLEGSRFVFPFHSEAPAGDRALTPHGTFFFRLLVPALSYLGRTHFACRIPGYLGGHLAVLAFLLFLLRRGFHIPALMLAFLWIGDKTTLQLVLGRPEGICMLLLVGSFVACAHAIDNARPSFLAVATCLGGLAVGFNTASLYFLIALSVFAMIRLRRQALGTFGWLVLGGLPPLVLLIWAWMPDPAATISSFFWYYGRYGRGSLLEKVVRFLSGHSSLGWGWAWAACLMLQSVVASILFLFRAREDERSPRRTVEDLLIVFSLVGVATYFISSAYPYYLSFLSIWAVCLLGMLAERFWSAGRWRKMTALLACALILTWLPSLAWNLLRFREAVIWYEQTDKKVFADALAAAVPQNAPVMGDPLYFLVARAAGIHYTILPLYDDDPKVYVPSGAYLLITDRYRHLLNGIDSSILGSRHLVRQVAAFPRDCYATEHVDIYGPSCVEGPAAP